MWTGSCSDFVNARWNFLLIGKMDVCEPEAHELFDLLKRV
jgi:hypothetical protein